MPEADAQPFASRIRAALAVWFPELSSTHEPGEPARVEGSFDLAPLIDHTLLTPTATGSDVRRLCEEAARYGFHAVCVHGARLGAAVVACGSSASPVAVACVVDFPMGAASTEARAHQASCAVAAGAREIDLVAPAGVLEAALLDDEPSTWNRELLASWVADIAVVTTSARSAGSCQLKLILETDRLTPTQTVAGALLAEVAGVDFVKTSTGFGKGGATLEAVALMFAAVGGRLGIKASGGITSRAEALAFVNAGVTRLGTSRSMALLIQP